MNNVSRGYPFGDRNILEAQPDLDLRVFAIWEQVLSGDEAAPPDALNDAR